MDRELVDERGQRGSGEIGVRRGSCGPAPLRHVHAELGCLLPVARGQQVPTLRMAVPVGDVEWQQHFVDILVTAVTW